MDVVLSVILIAVVCLLLAYFILQAWNAGYKIYKRQKKKREHRTKANEGKKKRKLSIVSPLSGVMKISVKNMNR